MNQSLAYLREILASHIENDAVGERIFEKILTYDNPMEREFVESLTEREHHYLNRVLVDAIKYSKQEQDQERVHQLNEVYELLFI